MNAFRSLIILVSAFASLPAAAWDGAPSGMITAFDVTGGQNYGFRVYLAGVSDYCGATPYNWPYLNEADSNYKTYVAALMMAKATGSPVTLYLTREGGGCKIGYISVR